MYFQCRFFSQPFELWKSPKFKLAKKKSNSRISINIHKHKYIPNQRVNFAHFNVVQLLDSGFDLMLVSLQVGNKDQGVVVFNLFHSRFSGQWMFDDVMCI